MDLEQLNKIDTSNAAQVKALQTFLKSRGYYNGPIDGKWGGGTTEGAVKLRTDLTTTANTARDTAVANQQASDPTNNAIRGATEIGPYVGGMAAGAGVGHAIGKGLKNQDIDQRAATKSIASNSKITSEAANAQMRGMRTARNAVTGAQFGAPALFLGSAEYLRRGIAPQFEGPDGKDTETSKWIKLGANLDQGVGLGVLGHQLVGLKSRIPSPNDPVDEALIRSRPPTAPPPPPDAPTAPPALRTPSDRLTSAARAAGATGKLNKTTAADYLAANVTPQNRAAVAAELGVGPGEKIAGAVKKLSISRKPSVLIGPSIAAGLGYDAASGDAEAAGATPGEARTRGAVAGTGAAAVTGGAMYGLSKLPKALTRAVGAGSGLLAPYAAADAYDPSPGELNRDRNVAARNLPSMLRGGGIEDAYQMAQVPEKSPTRSVLSGYTAQKAGPLPGASALQIPEGIPLPREDGASPYEAAQPARAAHGDQTFDDALSGFLALIQEHNSSIGGGEQPPNFRQAPAMIGAR